MNNNSNNKDFLYDVIGGFEDELIEKAADYKKSSKILSFPVFKYINAVAAFLICIISTLVFVQLKPIVEIDESLIIPTNQPTITATPELTEDPVVILMPVVESGDTETPSASTYPEKSPLATLRPMKTREPAVTMAPTKKPAVVVVPTMKPAATIKPIIIKPTNTPETTELVVKTPVATKVPVSTDRPVVTDEPESAPEVTKVPVETPIVTEAPKPEVTPTETVAPEPVPTETDKPIVTNVPTPTPPMITDEPTVRTVEPTEEPPIVTETPGLPMETSFPTAEPTHTPIPIITNTPIPTPIPTPTVEPTLRPTAPPLDIGECTSVEGIPVIIKKLNGAVYDSKKDIIEFTEESDTNKRGVEIVNPIAGNENMIADYGYLMDVDTGGLTNAFHLTGSYLGWGTDREKLPIPKEQLESGISLGNMDARIRTLSYADANTVYYPKPENRNGFSISYWANSASKQEGGPAIVFSNDSQCIVVTINGSVDYVDKEDNKNCFIADSDDYRNPGEWHYYTISFANDWITYYVDGIEIPYSNIQLRFSYIRSFNDGFGTRYNPTLAWNKEEYANDWRGYVKRQCLVQDDRIITLGTFTVIGVERYSGKNRTGKLLLDFMSSEDTRLLIGGGELGYNHSIAAYSQNAGTKYAQVKYYDVELTNKNVYANYHEALKSRPDL